MPYSDEIIKQLLFDGVDSISIDTLPDNFLEKLFASDSWANAVYEKLPLLIEKINEYFKWREDIEKGEIEVNTTYAGNLMEEIALLLFLGLRGINDIKSYSSYASQHDLVLEGSSLGWLGIMDFLHLPRCGRSIVIESKNQSSSISDQQFSRLCGLLENKFDNISHLGIFISRTKASGFPDGDDEHSLKYARATQALFHAKSNKYVIVVDESDLQLILDGANFLRIIEGKLREIEESTLIDTSFNEDWNLIVLPPHLSQYIE